MALTSNRGVSGTFTTTGQSAATDVCDHFSVDITSGTGTINVERLMPDGSTWSIIETLTIPDADNTDVAKEYEGIGASIRLNCTAHTGDMAYFVQGYNKAM